MNTREELCEAVGIPFSAEQLDAITAPLEPSVIIAGAGTGKTAVMAARVVWLVATGQVQPAEVLGLTFTRKAAGELAHRIGASLSNTGVRNDDEGIETVSTYDAFAAGVVTEFGIRAGLDVEPRLITGATRYRVALQVVRAADALEHLSRLQPDTIAERVLELAQAMESHLVSAEELTRFNSEARSGFEHAPGKGKASAPYAGMLRAVEACDERQELLGLVAAYQQLKAELGIVEFGDQLRTAERLVRTVPSVARELRRRFKVVLLDEYQDTSSAQAQLLSGLFRGHAVTAVGDPYQAIYGWRGAASSNILEFARQFSSGSAQQYTLTVNRRSGQRILDVGNSIAARIPGGTGVQLAAPPDKPVGQIEAARFDTDDDEIEFIVNRIRELGEQAAWKEIAVLCRVNASMGPIFEALRAQGIPAEIVGLEGLLSLPEIVPVVATLRVLADATANASVVTLLTSSRWNIGLADMAILGSHAEALGGRQRQQSGSLPELLAEATKSADPNATPSLLEAVFDPPAGLSKEGTRRLLAFRDEIRQLAGHMHDPLPELVQRIIRTVGVEEELIARGRGTQQLAKFVAECVRHTPVDGDSSLSGFLNHLEAEERHGVGLEQALVSEEDSVKVLTAHRAKGLEWDHVFLPGLSATVFPAGYRSGHWPQKAEALPAPLRGDAASIAQLEEYSEAARKEYLEQLKEEHGHSEDRLAYVAATRARQHLIGTRHVWRSGRKKPLEPSPYFDVIWHAAVEVGTTIDQLTDAEENPMVDQRAMAAWPSRGDEHTDLQQSAAELVHAAQQNEEWVLRSGTLPAEVAEQFRRWDESAAHVISARERSKQRIIQLPKGLSATALIAMRDDPQAFAEQLIRRMPRQPSANAHLGTLFHEWMERRFEQAVSFEEFDTHPKALEPLIEAFERGQFADRVPIAIEVPFSMAVGPYQLRGRIDAVYAWDRDDFDEIVVDWKTSDAPADALQLAVYRRAWAESRGLPESRVGAAFHHVRSDRLVFPEVNPEQINKALGL